MASDLDSAGAHQAVTPRPVRRALASVGLLSLARAVALGVVTWLLNGPDSGLSFVLGWTLLFLPLAVLTAVVELPLILGLSPRAPSSARAAVTAAVAGALWGALLVRYVPWLRAVGGSVAFALALAGLAATLAPPIGLRSRPVAISGTALIVALLVTVVAADPEADYGKRYAENRLTPAHLATPPPFPNRDPATLSDAEVAAAIAKTWLETHPTEGLRWSWEEAVVLEGLLSYGDAANDPAPTEYAKRWIADHKAEAFTTPLWADVSAPAATCLRVGAGDKVVERVALYIRDDAPRTRAGVLSHLGVLAGGLAPPQAWIDTSFMHGVFLNRLFAKGDDWAGKEARDLALAMQASLLDERTALFRHASFDLGPITFALPIEPMFWARGNGWSIYFLVDHQVARQRRGLAPDPAVADLLSGHALALLACQDPDGLWRTDLLGAPNRDNPIETSASALILASLQRARRAGLLAGVPRVPLLKGRRALRAAIRWNKGHPTVTGVSTGTMPGFRRYYREIPVDENVAHGVGAFLLVLSQPEPQ